MAKPIRKTPISRRYSQTSANFTSLGLSHSPIKAPNGTASVEVATSTTVTGSASDNPLD
jgi:hypothetical protein